MLNYLDIENFASNRAVYLRGIDYFNLEKIKSLKSNDNFSLNWESVVSGNYDEYQVNIGLDKDSNIVDYKCQCNCNAFQKYNGACKHIIAVLLKLKKLFDEKSILPDTQNYFSFDSTDTSVIDNDNMSNYDDLDIDDIIDGLFKKKPIKKKSYTDINVIESLMSDYKLMEKSNYNKELLEIDFDLFITNNSTYIEYKVGFPNKHKYIIKDISYFVNALKKESTFEFGKNLICDFKKDKFDDKSKKIIAFINQCFTKEKNVQNILKGNRLNSYLSEGKRQYLLSEDIRKFFEIFENEKITIITENNVKSKVLIKDGLPEMEFYLTYENNSYFLNTNGIHLLDSDILANSGIYIQKNIAYLINDEDNKFLKPLFKINQLNIFNFKISKENELVFINNIVPYLINKTNFYLPKSLSYDDTLHDLKTEIFVENNGQNLLIFVHFIYGDTIFSSDNTPLTNNGKIIKTNPLEEAEITKFFQKYRLTYFDKTESLEAHFTMNLEQDIYDFLFEDIKELEKIATVHFDAKIEKIRKNNKFSMMVNLEGDYLNIDFKMEDMSISEMKELYYSYKIKKPFYRLKSGTFINFQDESLKKQLNSIEKIIPDDDDFSSKIKIPQYKSFYIDLLGSEHFDNYEKNKAFDNYIKKIKNLNVEKYDDSLLNNVKLRDYQKFGVQWLESLSKINLGGILADDMGLGKTLQVIALLSKKHLDKPTLIIVPKTLLYNWEKELNKFSPNLKLLIIEGSIAQRKKMLKTMNKFDIVITSYSLFRSDIDIYENFQFSYCFLDEAQHIKNPAINLTKAIKSVNAKHRFALTGTPIENNLSELWSIFDFIMPGYLGNHNFFTKNYINPIMKQNDTYAIESLGFHIKPFILRRMKKDVLLELPPKIEVTQLCELDTEQKKLYQSQLEIAKQEIKQEIQNEGLAKSQIKIFSLLTRLRQICCHPKLFIDNYNHESGKFEALFELFEDLISAKHKTLVFSQFTTMLKLISSKLEKKGIDHYYLDGNMKARDRLELVNSFNKGKTSIFLISLKAGGTGLNLVGSDTVIHVDPWWNPSVENQASDRAHRIGQKNIVQVIKLITKGTIEEKIMNLQEKKRQLIENVLKSEGSLINTFSEEDIRNIFDI